MQIASFGPIIFEVSADKVRTFSEFSRKSAATFAEHARVNGKARLQHTGAGLDESSLSMRFSYNHGLNPAKELGRVQEVLAAGKAYPLIIGGKVLGDYVLTTADEAWQKFGPRGELLVATAKVSLKEWVR